MNTWLKHIDSTELQYIAAPLSILNSGTEEETEMAASFLYKGGLASPMACISDEEKLIDLAERENERRPPKKYWDQVKKEIFLLLCTNHEKYDDLRSSLEKTKEKGTQAIIASISCSIATLLGIEAGLISAFCAIVLNSVIKVGKEAYCAIKREEYA